MPSKAPHRSSELNQELLNLGGLIRARRKEIKVSATAVAEAAGVSRMTLNRVEKGEASVTIGAYLNIISVLGLELNLVNPAQSQGELLPKHLKLDSQISLSKYPQLKKLAWQYSKATKVTPKDALSIYERNWRHMDLSELMDEEKQFIKELLALFGRERLLV